MVIERYSGKTDCMEGRFGDMELRTSSMADDRANRFRFGDFRVLMKFDLSFVLILRFGLGKEPIGVIPNSLQIQRNSSEKALDVCCAVRDYSVH